VAIKYSLREMLRAYSETNTPIVSMAVVHGMLDELSRSEGVGTDAYRRVFLTRVRKEGWLRPLKRGWVYLEEFRPRITLETVARTLYPDNVISMGSALIMHAATPEVQQGSIDLLSLDPNARKEQTPFGLLDRHCVSKERLLLGCDHDTNVACPEKALLDLAFLKAYRGEAGTLHNSGFRINWGRIDAGKLASLAKLYPDSVMATIRKMRETQGSQFDRARTHAFDRARAGREM
jgi:hypothetical protein